MRELTNDPFYEVIHSYPSLIIDYCLLADEIPHLGIRSHKVAVLTAMFKVIERYMEQDIRDELRHGTAVPEDTFPWKLDMAKAQAHPIETETFLHVPKILSTDRYGIRKYDCDLPNAKNEEPIPYWYAFWETPQPSGYGPEEFQKVNSAMFPKGTDRLEVYVWTTDWSNYFDDGHEWWGAACWSVYDPQMNRYAVLFASATD